MRAARCALRLLGVVLATTLAAAPVRAIVGGTPTTAFGQVGGGVQVTANWVLTAHHLGYAAGDVFANGYGLATVAQVYNASNAGFPQDDLTLLRLGQPIAAPALLLLADPFAEGTLPSPIDATIATAANQQPRGYGQTQLREVAGQIDPDGDGPQGLVTVNYLIAYGAGFSGPWVEPGDSGGGLFLGAVTDSVSPLMGITSAAISFDAAGQQHASGFVALSAYRGWIDGVMAADATDAQQAAWVSAVPEPASLALLLAGGALLLGLRRRRG